MLNLTISNNLSRKTEAFNDNLSLIEAIQNAGFEFSAGTSVMWNGRVVDPRASLARLDKENPTRGGGPASVCIIFMLKNA